MSLSSCTAQSNSSWGSLPGDVFNTISESLPPAHRCLLPQVCSSWRALASSLHSNCSYWRNMCLRKWGPAVLACAPPALRSHSSPANETAAWRRYYIQRVAWFDLPTSPCKLIQEFQGGDPWHIMVACQLSSRTGASMAKHDVLSCVLSAFPTPSAMISAPKAVLEAMLDRVGMQEQRAAALARMSSGFLGDWQTPSQLYGIGPFGQESVYLFQRGAAAWSGFKTNDSNLRIYLAWARSDLRKLGYSAAATAVNSDVQDAVAAAADASTADYALHTPAQAHLMASACPPVAKRDAKLCSAAAASAFDNKHAAITVAAARKRTTRAASAGPALPVVDEPKRPRRCAARRSPFFKK